MPLDKRTVLFIVGPTAIGKTALALKLAVVKSTDGSVGKSEEDGTSLCPFSSKNFINFSLIS